MIFEAQPLVASTKHFGCRLAFMRDGTLLVTMGERFVRRELAQDLGTDLGKVLRINRDGSAPPDNPFVGRKVPAPKSTPTATATRKVSSSTRATARSGRRSTAPWAATRSTASSLAATTAGRWSPTASITMAHPSAPVRAPPRGLSRPSCYWDPSIAPSGLALYLGDKFPGWQGDLLVGALKYQLVSRLHLDEAGRVVSEEQFLKGALGRIRDVREGPDGLVYLVTDENPGSLYRLEPVTSAE